MNKDLIKFYKNEVLPQLNISDVLKELNPKDYGSYYTLNCPSCGKNRAFIYKGTDLIRCNRNNNCSYFNSIVAFQNGGSMPSGIEWVNVVKKLCEVSGITFPSEDWFTNKTEKYLVELRCNKLFMDFQKVCTLELKKNEKAKSFLRERGISEEDINKYQLCFYPGDNQVKKQLGEKGYLPSEIKKSGIFRSDWSEGILFPKTARGITVDFFVRKISKDGNKWSRLSKDNCHVNGYMFGLDKAEGEAIIVEGAFDYIALDSNGVENVIAADGSKITNDQIKQLKAHGVKKIILLFDNDSAGREGLEKTTRKLVNSDIDVMVVPPSELKDKKDPDEFVRAYGAKDIKDSIYSAKHSYIYTIEEIITRNKPLIGAWTNNQEQDLLREVISFIDRAQRPEKNHWVGKALDLLEQKTPISRQSLDEYRKKAGHENCIRSKVKEAQKALERGNIEQAQLTMHSTPTKNNLFEFNEKKAHIGFLSEKEECYLTDQPPKMARLLKRKNGKSFLVKGITALLVGPGGSGKTHLLTNLAISLATGKNFLEQYEVEETGAVFVGLGENNNDDIWRLFNKTAHSFYENDSTLMHHKSGLKDAGKNIAVCSLTGMNTAFLDKNGEQTDFLKKLTEELILKEPANGWVLLIFDPISRFLGPDAESDNALATRFIALLEHLIQQLKGKPTIICGHHMSKSATNAGESVGQTAARGSSALTDGVRFQINLEYPKEGNFNGGILMSQVKSNHTAPEDPLYLKKNEVGCLSLNDYKEKKQKSAEPCLSKNTKGYGEKIVSAQEH